jgi:hypothetical protein
VQPRREGALGDTQHAGKGYLVGAACCLASGVGLWAILPHFWGVGLLVFLVGLALLPFGIQRK